MTMYKAVHPRDDICRLYVSRKMDDEDPPTLKIASIRPFHDCIKKDELHQPETIETTKGSTKQQYLKNENWIKNFFIDI